MTTPLPLEGETKEKPTMAKPIIKVTATDIESGESGTREIEANDYCLIATEPLYLANEQRHANGTIVITLKRREGSR